MSRSSPRTPRLLDHGALGLSAVCLVHCLAFPLIAAAAPVLGAFLPDAPWVHPAILGLAAPLALVALGRGWQRHRDAPPVVLGVGGIALLAGGVFASGAAAETVLTVAGALVLAAAHLLNWRGTHRG